MKNPKSPPSPDAGPRIGPRPFGVVIAELADGDLERRLTAEFADLVRAVKETSKAGKIVLTIAADTDGKMIRVVADTKVTLPRPAIEGTAFFSDDRGGLHRENPRQTKLWPPWPYGDARATVSDIDTTDDEGGES